MNALSHAGFHAIFKHLLIQRLIEIGENVPDCLHMSYLMQVVPPVLFRIGEIPITAVNDFWCELSGGVSPTPEARDEFLRGAVEGLTARLDGCIEEILREYKLCDLPLPGLKRRRSKRKTSKTPPSPQLRPT